MKLMVQFLPGNRLVVVYQKNRGAKFNYGASHYTDGGYYLESATVPDAAGTTLYVRGKDRDHDWRICYYYGSDLAGTYAVLINRFNAS